MLDMNTRKWDLRTSCKHVMTAKINPVQSIPTRQRAVAGISTTFVEIEDLVNIKKFSRRAHNNRPFILRESRQDWILVDQVARGRLTESMPERTISHRMSFSAHASSSPD